MYAPRLLHSTCRLTYSYVIGLSQWPGDHLGPVLTLMASCNGDCSTFNPTDGKWFKIDEGGYTNGKWASEQLIASTLDFQTL